MPASQVGVGEEPKATSAVPYSGLPSLKALTAFMGDASIGADNRVFFDQTREIPAERGYT